MGVIPSFPAYRTSKLMCPLPAGVQLASTPRHTGLAPRMASSRPSMENLCSLFWSLRTFGPSQQSCACVFSSFSLRPLFDRERFDRDSTLQLASIKAAGVRSGQSPAQFAGMPQVAIINHKQHSVGEGLSNVMEARRKPAKDPCE